MVTHVAPDSTRVTLSECGMKDSKVGDMGATTMDVTPWLSTIHLRSTRLAARKVRENHFVCHGLGG